MAQISAQSPLLVRLLEDRSWSRDNKTLILDMSPKEKKQLLFLKWHRLCHSRLSSDIFQAGEATVAQV